MAVHADGKCRSDTWPLRRCRHGPGSQCDHGYGHRLNVPIWFGNVLSLALRLGVPVWIAPGSAGRAAVRDHLAQAAAAAELVGDQRNDYWFAFGECG